MPTFEGNVELAGVWVCLTTEYSRIKIISLCVCLLGKLNKSALRIFFGDIGVLPGGGDSHMKQTGMLVGNFEFNP